MESFWALVRRGYNGTFHRSPSTCTATSGEFAGRLGMRTLSTAGKMCAIVQDPAGRRLTHAQLAAPDTLCGRP